MTEYVRWSSGGYRERAEEIVGGRDEFMEGAQRMLAESHAWRLVETRHERGCTPGAGG